MTSKFVFTPRFERSVKHLRKRYRNIAADLENGLTAIEYDPTLGAVIPDDYQVRKLRISSRDMQRGKSGGFRLLYKHKMNEETAVSIIFLLFVYAKTDQDDVSLNQLKAMVDDLPKSNDPES